MFWIVLIYSKECLILKYMYIWLGGYFLPVFSLLIQVSYRSNWWPPNVAAEVHDVVRSFFLWSSSGSVACHFPFQKYFWVSTKAHSSDMAKIWQLFRSNCRYEFFVVIYGAMRFVSPWYSHDLYGASIFKDLYISAHLNNIHLFRIVYDE